MFSAYSVPKFLVIVRRVTGFRLLDASATTNCDIEASMVNGLNKTKAENRTKSLDRLPGQATNPHLVLTFSGTSRIGIGLFPAGRPSASEAAFVSTAALAPFLPLAACPPDAALWVVVSEATMFSMMTTMQQLESK